MIDNDESKRLQLHLSCLLSFALCCSTFNKNHSLKHSIIHFSMNINTNHKPSHFPCIKWLHFTSLTLGPVIKFNQVKESMNQSMTNSTQLNFKNQVKIKLQVKLQAQTTTSKLNSQRWAGPSNFNYQTYQLNFNLTTCLQPSLSLRFQNQLKLSYSFTHSLTPQLIQTFKPT